MRRVQRDDLVEVRSGKDRGRRGQVRQVLPKNQRVIVTGLNMVKRHMQATQLGAPAGIIEREAPLHESKVAVVCPICDLPTRVGFRERADGAKTRVCRKCDGDID
ncbi:MAG: 50S ribosomal protein L24 [Chloroflexi bacterium]|nr:50S ribosomal protein L24 [Chloroflexota bacterium]MYF81269.1 50S ribosomal protein L24 [Chloroflexota bacterium]MYI04169.1 50S ribosomal protein L24 [Chloroflexota bacterium]